MDLDSARIDELRRRVDKDPASIAFAHLAEEHRRAGQPDEAVRVCRAGLVHHPTYLLARVTLGRALMNLEQYSEARIEFEYVLSVAPDNLIALNGMTELQHRAGVDLAPRGASPTQAVRASPPEAVDPALEELQGWLNAIEADREERAGGSASSSVKDGADEPRTPPD